MHSKLLSTWCQPFCLNLNVLTLGWGIPMSGEDSTLSFIVSGAMVQRLGLGYRSGRKLFISFYLFMLDSIFIGSFYKGS